MRLPLSTNTIRFRLLASLVVVMVAVLILEALVVHPLFVRDHKKSASDSLTSMAAQAATNLETSMRASVAELEALARLDEIRSMDRARIDRALGLLDNTSGLFNYYFVLDANGRWVSYPQRPEVVGRGIPAENSGWVRAAATTDRSVFLDVIETRIGALVTGVAVPIKDDEGSVIGILRGVIVVSDNNTVRDSVVGGAEAGGFTAYVVSGSGRLVAHSGVAVDSSDDIDYTAYGPVRAAISGSVGIMEYEYKGTPQMAAYHPISTPGWALVVQRPMGEILQAAGWEAGLSTSLASLVFVASVLVMGMLLSVALRPLPQLLKKIESGEIEREHEFGADEIGVLARKFHDLYVELHLSEAELRRMNEGLDVLVRERTDDLRAANERLEAEIVERVKAEDMLRKSLTEKETLVREVHHRARNNMQIILSLLRMQAERTRDGAARSALKDSESRVRTMSLIHDRLLHAEDMSSIRMGPYIDQLVRLIWNNFPDTLRDVMIRKVTDDLSFTLETAIPVGLILNELIGNALGHGFSGGRRGAIELRLKEMDGGVVLLNITDDGRGLPETLDREAPGTLGLGLVRTLATGQLRGELFIESPVTDHGGTSVTIKFTPAIYNKRL